VLDALPPQMWVTDNFKRQVVDKVDPNFAGWTLTELPRKEIKEYGADFEYMLVLSVIIEMEMKVPESTTFKELKIPDSRMRRYVVEDERFKGKVVLDFKYYDVPNNTNNKHLYWSELKLSSFGEQDAD